MIARRLVVLAVVPAVLLIGACGDEKKDASSSPAASEPSSACPEGQTEIHDGLCYVDTKVGDGPEVAKGDVLNMNYVGKLEDGSIFDQSSGQPLQFKLGTGAVIQGWDEGILGMKVGGKRTLTIPPDLAYGKSGYPPVIPPNATLIFDVEVVSIEK